MPPPGALGAWEGRHQPHPGWLLQDGSPGLWESDLSLGMPSQEQRGAAISRSHFCKSQRKCLNQHCSSPWGETCKGPEACLEGMLARVGSPGAHLPPSVQPMQGKALRATSNHLPRRTEVGGMAALKEQAGPA